MLKEKKKEMEVMYCPTKERAAALFTKPLQGMLFITHPDAVLGIHQDNIPLYRQQYNLYITNRNNVGTA